MKYDDGNDLEARQQIHGISYTEAAGNQQGRNEGEERARGHEDHQKYAQLDFGADLVYVHPEAGADGEVDAQNHQHHGHQGQVWLLEVYEHPHEQQRHPDHYVPDHEDFPPREGRDRYCRQEGSDEIGAPYKIDALDGGEITFDAGLLFDVVENGGDVDVDYVDARDLVGHRQEYPHHRRPPVIRVGEGVNDAAFLGSTGFGFSFSFDLQLLLLHLLIDILMQLGFPICDIHSGNDVHGFFLLISFDVPRQRI